MWKPGQSGNPTGKKPGTGKVDRLRAALAKDLPEVLDALVTKAKEGDTGAIKLVLERTVPALRPVDAPAVLNLPVDGGLADQGRTVMAALAAGYLPANQAAGILQGLGNLAKLVELDELEKRIAALEGKQP
ncbi:MAG: DUF5681 domain-containing protein [Candidatus Contendobacter sp.]|nr:DUF5681 domain-containing protein [Candidatus Contendobacter sp.]MDS4058899.1 DUF5681 domain-containing protein [Candidatus Contendobacter sp.]